MDDKKLSIYQFEDDGFIDGTVDGYIDGTVGDIKDGVYNILRNNDLHGGEDGANDGHESQVTRQSFLRSLLFLHISLMLSFFLLLRLSQPYHLPLYSKIDSFLTSSTHSYILCELEGETVMLGENDGNDWHELQVIGQSILASSVLSHKDATSPSRFVP